MWRPCGNHTIHYKFIVAMHLDVVWLLLLTLEGHAEMEAQKEKMLHNDSQGTLDLVLRSIFSQKQTNSFDLKALKDLQIHMEKIIKKSEKKSGYLAEFLLYYGLLCMAQLQNSEIAEKQYTVYTN